MGFIDDKINTSNLISQFGVLSTLPQTRATSAIQSVTSKNKNLLPFLLDMTNQACQDHYITSTSENKDPNMTKNCEITRMVLEILTKFLPALGQIIKEGIIKAIKTSFNCGNDTIIPSYPIIATVDIKNIDLSGVLKIDPESQGGKLMYGTDPKKDINLFIYNLIQNSSTDEQFLYNINGEKMIGIQYLTGDKLVLRIANNNNALNNDEPYAGRLFDDFLRDFMGSISVLGPNGAKIGDKVKFMFNQIIDNLFGSISVETDASLDFLIETEQVSMMMEKIFESDPCEFNSTIDNSFFDFSNEELDIINTRAKARSRGFNSFDLGVGPSGLPYIVEGTNTASVDIGVLTTINENLTNAEPAFVNDVIEQSLVTINTEISKNVVTSEIDKLSVEKNFSINFVREMPKVFTNVIFTPKILVMYQLVSVLFKNESMTATSSQQFVFDNKVFFNFVARESLAALIEIIFEQLKREVLRLVSSFATKLINQQADLRIKAILSIVYGISEGLLNSVPTPNTSEFT
jgi:hypothetical protein